MSHPFPIILSSVSSSLDVILYLFFDYVYLWHLEAMRFGSLFLFFICDDYLICGKFYDEKFHYSIL